MKKKLPFEEKHKIISLLTIILLTIITTRAITSLIDPNLSINGYELHHFHYGLALLIITSIMLLYSRGFFRLNLILIGISLGLITDELMFISGKVRGTIVYNSTLFPTIVLVIIISLIVEAIFYYRRKNN